MQFSAAIFDTHACSYYIVTVTKGCSVYMHDVTEW